MIIFHIVLSILITFIHLIYIIQSSYDIDLSNFLGAYFLYQALDSCLQII